MAIMKGGVRVVEKSPRLRAAFKLTESLAGIRHGVILCENSASLRLGGLFPSRCSYLEALTLRKIRRYPEI